jgi:hypothetical protein
MQYIKNQPLITKNYQFSVKDGGFVGALCFYFRFRIVVRNDKKTKATAESLTFWSFKRKKVTPKT